MEQARTVEDRLKIINRYAWEIRRSYPLRSLELGKTARELSLDLGDKVELANSYENTGTAYYLLSMYQDALTDLMIARNMFSELGCEPEEADVIRTIGNIFHSINENDRAIDEYYVSLEIAERIGDQLKKAYTLGNIGYVLKKKGELTSSKKHMVKAINIMLRLDDDPGLSDAFNILGTIHLEEGAVESAYKEFLKAYFIASKCNHVRGMANAKMNMGSYFLAKKSKEEALDEYAKALDYASKMGEKLLIAEIYKHLSDVYETFDEPQKALNYFKDYERLKAQIFEGVKQHEISAAISDDKLKQAQKEKEHILQRSKDLEAAYKQIEEKNRELEKLSMVASKMNEAVLIADSSGKIEFMNEGFLRNSGYSKSEFVDLFEGDLTLQKLSSKEDIDRIVEEFKTSKDVVQYDSYHHKKDGSVMWTSGSLSPVYKNGKLHRIVVVYSDITQRKGYADRLKKTNKNIVDSLNYARTIQEAVLPDQNRFAETFADHFVLFQPRDIVSGDFYWLDRRKDHVIFAVVDCTGHGVPGGFMSMMGNDYLTQIVTDSDVNSPAEALGLLNDKIQKALRQTDDSDSKDGMDMALCALNLRTLEMEYAGANNPVYIIRNGEIIELEPTRESIAGGRPITNKTFDLRKFQLKENDRLYLFTDGYADQFGGPSHKTGGKKMGYRGFKEVLLTNHELPMAEQKKKLVKHFNQWRRDMKQIDDVCIIGVRV